MKLWYMNDNHTFCELPHDVDAAIAEVRRMFQAGQTYGMLCVTVDGRSNASPFDKSDNAHARGDFKEFEPRARKWLTAALAYKSAGDLEYESWVAVDARSVIVSIADQPLADAASVLAEFAKTAPGRLPQRVHDAIAVALADGPSPSSSKAESKGDADGRES